MTGTDPTDAILADAVQQAAWLAAANIASVTFIKLALIIGGFLVIQTGARLLEKGVQGSFTFKTSMQGMQADLVSASPGLLFVLIGGIMMITAVVTKFDGSFGFSDEQTAPQTNTAPVERPVMERQSPFQSGGES